MDVKDVIESQIVSIMNKCSCTREQAEKVLVVFVENDDADIIREKLKEILDK